MAKVMVNSSHGMWNLVMCRLSLCTSISVALKSFSSSRILAFSPSESRYQGLSTVLSYDWILLTVTESENWTTFVPAGPSFRLSEFLLSPVTHLASRDM